MRKSLAIYTHIRRNRKREIIWAIIEPYWMHIWSILYVHDTRTAAPRHGHSFIRIYRSALVQCFSINILFVVFQLFDMKKFQQNVSRELRRAYPDRRRLECQCLSAISFVKNEPDMLDSPIWVLIINVVAMDMLKSKLPPSKRISRYHLSSLSPSFLVHMHSNIIII